MCGKIDCYIEAFSKLQTDKNKRRWSAATNFRAPHKPFLLLAILDDIAIQKINREFIEPTPELADKYASYWQRALGDNSVPDMAIPFFELEQEPFWSLAPHPGTISQHETIESLAHLKEHYLGAKIDYELFKLCLMEPLRKRLQATLITTYFDPAAQKLLLDYYTNIKKTA